MLCFLPEPCARGCTPRVWPCERGSVHVRSVTRFLQHCARGIEPASVELAGLRHAAVFCPSTVRGVAHLECAPASVGEYRFVALPASYSTEREGLNLPVWSWRDYGMLCFLPSPARGVAHAECGPVSVGVYMCVASPAFYSTVREGLNLPVWSWRDYGMLLYLARALCEGLHT